MKIKFRDFIYESVEKIKIDVSIREIMDSYLTYEHTRDYLMKEVVGKTVNVSNCMYGSEKINNIDINVIDVILNDRYYQIHFIDKNGRDYSIADRARLKWNKEINRNISDEDPYGEDDE